MGGVCRGVWYSWAHGTFLHGDCFYIGDLGGNWVLSIWEDHGGGVAAVHAAAGLLHFWCERGFNMRFLRITLLRESEELAYELKRALNNI